MSVKFPGDVFFHRAEIFQKLGPRCRGTLRTKSRGAFRNEQLQVAQHCFNTLGLETNKKQLFLFTKKTMNGIHRASKNDLRSMKTLDLLCCEYVFEGEWKLPRKLT